MAMTNGEHVTWLDPDGGARHGARIESYDPSDDTFWLALDSGGEAEVPRTEVKFEQGTHP